MKVEFNDNTVDVLATVNFIDINNPQLVSVAFGTIMSDTSHSLYMENSYIDTCTYRGDLRPLDSVYFLDQTEVDFVDDEGVQYIKGNIATLSLNFLKYIDRIIKEYGSDVNIRIWTTEPIDWFIILRYLLPNTDEGQKVFPTQMNMQPTSLSTFIDTLGVNFDQVFNMVLTENEKEFGSAVNSTALERIINYELAFNVALKIAEKEI